MEPAGAERHRRSPKGERVGASESMEDSKPSDIDGQAARPSEWGRASQIRVIRGAFQEAEDGGRIGGQRTEGGGQGTEGENGGRRGFWTGR
jgi:hypothetical protein